MLSRLNGPRDDVPHEDALEGHGQGLQPRYGPGIGDGGMEVPHQLPGPGLALGGALIIGFQDEVLVPAGDGGFLGSQEGGAHPDPFGPQHQGGGYLTAIGDNAGGGNGGG